MKLNNLRNFRINNSNTKESMKNISKRISWLFSQVIPLILFIVFVMPLYSSAQLPSQDIDSIMAQQHRNNNFNGVALVSIDGDIVYEKGWGHANESWEVPNTKTTKFRIGSCTKPLTATLIMTLIEEGKLKLDDPVTRYFPDLSQKHAKKITIRNLLEHTSGIPDYTGLDFFEERMHVKNEPGEFIKNFWNKELRFEPGTALKYTNSGYYLLGVLIEKITGQTYEEVLATRFFDPLNMYRSGLYKNDTIIKESARGYIHEKGTLKKAPHVNYSVAYSSCGVYSTARDIYKWQQAFYKNRLLPEELKQKMLEPRYKHYGLGFTIATDTLQNGTSVTTFGHEGGIFGFRSLLHMFENRNHLIVLLDNHDHNNLKAIAKEIRGVIFNDK